MTQPQDDEFGTSYLSTLHDPLFAPLTVFLSASVMQAGREDEATFPARDPDIVRAAVTSTVREVLRRGWNVVFGGHPQISPMLLVLAREFEGQRGGRILCFQSDHFIGSIPNATKQLGSYGTVLRTPEIQGVTPKETRELSLERMRNDMLGVPHLRAGVFLGGMKGVLDEARILRGKRISDLLMFAFPGTGSAAEQLFESDKATYSGDSAELAALMEKRRGQAVVAKRVVEHLAPGWTGIP